MCVQSNHKVDRVEVGGSESLFRGTFKAIRRHSRRTL